MPARASYDGIAALVTGASRGIGRLLALRFARAGPRLALVGRRSDATTHTLPDELMGGSAVPPIPQRVIYRPAIRTSLRLLPFAASLLLWVDWAGGREALHAVPITARAVALGAPLSVQAADRRCTEGVFASRIVAIDGQQLKPLLGQPVSELRMWAYEGGERRSIPFQVDVCGTDGRLLLPALGERAMDRLLGDRSVLLFALSDAGDKSTGPASEGVAEIEIRGPEDGKSRWAYLGRTNGTVASSPLDYVTYDPQNDTVHGQRYTVRFHRGYADFFSIAAATGQNTGNLIDRWKIRVEARVLWGFLRFRRNEEDVDEEVIGYIDGPIRVIRRSRLKTKIGWGISSPEGIADDYFYGDHYGGPSEIRIPFKLARVFGDVDVRIYLDSRDMHGFEITAENHDPLVAGDSSSSRTPQPAGLKVSWFMMTHADLGFLHRLRLSPTLDGVKCELFYVDDADHADPPEAVPGLRPGVGYRLTNWGSVGRGLHVIWTETYVIDPAKFAQPQTGVSLLSSPPHVAIRWVSAVRASSRDLSSGPP